MEEYLPLTVEQLQARKDRGERLNDYQTSKLLGHQRPLTPRQLQVLRALRDGGTEREAYQRLIDSDPSWTKHLIDYRGQPFDYTLSFLDFRQHLINAYGRLQVHNRAEALAALNQLEEE